MSRQSCSRPIDIRWDHTDGKGVSKVTVPPKSYHANAGDQKAFKALLDGCAPASFGKDGVDVMVSLYISERPSRHTSHVLQRHLQ